MEVLEDTEYEKAIQQPDSVLICESGKECSNFEDSISDTCDTCGCDIHYRPYNKNATKKLCKECYCKEFL